MSTALLGWLPADPVVFGDWGASPSPSVPMGWWTRHCGPCQVTWIACDHRLTNCWCCGRPWQEAA